MRGQEWAGPDHPRGPSPWGNPAHDPTRRAFLVGAAVTLSTPVLSACGKGSRAGSGSSRAVEYVVIGAQDWVSRARSDLATFAATDPGFAVTQRPLTSSEYDEHASPVVFGADPPALMWHTVSRARFADIVATGAAADLTDFWAEALPDVSPATAAWYTFRGRKYAVPLDIVLYPLICYDVALFRRLGIVPPPAPIRSWPESEFLDACAALHAAGLDPLAVGGLDMSQRLVEAIAVTMLSPEELGHYTVDAWQPGSPYRYTDGAWVQVFARLRKWASENVFQPRTARVDQVSAQRAFVGGMAGMVAGGSWTVSNLKGLAAGAEPEVDWMLFPTISHPSRLLSCPGNGAFIPAASPQREQAERLLAFMLRQDRVLAAAEAYGHIPAFELPGRDRVLDARVVSMLGVDARRGGAAMNWPTELEAPFARACRAVLAGSSTPEEAGEDLEDAASLARAGGLASEGS